MFEGVDLYGRISKQTLYALEERDKMIEREGWYCWRCKIHLPDSRGQRAHRIADTKQNAREYGKYVLDHVENILHSCPQCNSYAMHFDSIQEREEMLSRIVSDLEARGLPTTGEKYHTEVTTEKQQIREERRRREADLHRENSKRQNDNKAKEREKIKAIKKERVQKKKEIIEEMKKKNISYLSQTPEYQRIYSKLTWRKKALKNYEYKMVMEYGWKWKEERPDLPKSRHYRNKAEELKNVIAEFEKLKKDYEKKIKNKRS